MINILAYDNNVYLVNLDKNGENVYIVNIKQGVIMGYGNVHKIMRFGIYEAFDMNKLTKKLENHIKEILNKYDIKPLI